MLSDKKFYAFFIPLQNTACTVNELRGDANHAARRGTCLGKDEISIDKEIDSICNELQKEFDVQKVRAYTKWLKNKGFH